MRSREIYGCFGQRDVSELGVASGLPITRPELKQDKPNLLKLALSGVCGESGRRIRQLIGLVCWLTDIVSVGAEICDT